jgi:hypothetical protein
MTGFDVDPHLLTCCGEEVLGYADEISQVAESVRIILGGMNYSYSGSAEYARSLARISGSMMHDALRCRNLGSALKYIASQYQEADNVAAGIHNPAVFMREARHAAGMGVLENLGLDDDYYRQQAGLEAGGLDRMQERVMDQYLSEQCRGLLNEERYSERTWQNATPEERREMMESFILEINHIMGTDVDRNVTFVSISGSTRGFYDPDTNAVTINSRYLSMPEGQGYAIMRTMIHEMRHCYQHTAAQNAETFVVGTETLEQWRYNFDHYRSTSDGYTYDEYVSQPIEWDAKNFAGQYGDIAGHTPDYAGSWG